MKIEGDHRRGPQTARLLLRAFEASDAESFFRLNSDPDVMRYPVEPPCESIAAARAGIEAYPDWDQFGFGRWGAICRASKAVIGFAGARVIEETIREKLPEGFQRAEYLLEHGMIDMVVHRQEIRETLIQVLGLLVIPRLEAGSVPSVLGAGLSSEHLADVQNTKSSAAK